MKKKYTLEQRLEVVQFAIDNPTMPSWEIANRFNICGSLLTNWKHRYKEKLLQEVEKKDQLTLDGKSETNPAWVGGDTNYSEHIERCIKGIEKQIEQLRTDLFNVIDKRSDRDNLSHLFSYVRHKIYIQDVVHYYTSGKFDGCVSSSPCVSCDQYNYNHEDGLVLRAHDNIFYCRTCKAYGDIFTYVGTLYNKSPLFALCAIIDHFKMDIPEDLQEEYKKIKIRENY